MKPPARPDSVCSKTFGAPKAICIFGDVKLETGQITGPRVKSVSVSGFTIRGFKSKEDSELGVEVIDGIAARDSNITGNDFMDNSGKGEAIAFSKTLDSAIEGNNVFVGGKEGAINVSSSNRNTTVTGNNIRGGTVFGIIVQERSVNTTVARNDVTDRGFFAGNDFRDNCAGMFFEAFKDEPVGGFEVKGNTFADNTHSCGSQDFGRNFSRIGIALLGASGMRLTANHLWGNIPSGPIRISGGVVVATDLYFGVTAKPRNNSVVANHFGSNKPDIFYDGSGSGNQFRANNCGTSVPSRLCN